HAIMSPPPNPTHGGFQARIASLLDQYLTTGRVLTECPISTADGVKAADVAWASDKLIQKLGQKICFTQAPEICIEVVSPGNTELEIQEKMALYFDAGAKEVWICSKVGALTFFGKGSRPLQASQLCSGFPKRIQLR